MKCPICKTEVTEAQFKDQAMRLYSKLEVYYFYCLKCKTTSKIDKLDITDAFAPYGDEWI
jgi:hypothetical protein